MSDPAILIVDDRPENLMALEVSLEDLGARLVRASSGQEALAATLHDDFALAILDVRMPGMDGHELARWLRSDPKTSNLPIIFLTADTADEEQQFRGYDMGAVDYIFKPVDPRILLSKARVFLQLERQRRELESYRDHLEELVGERTRELARSNHDLEQFAYVVSHDLQEPLRMISSYTKLLERRYGDALDDDAREFIGYAVDGCKRMEELINALLHLSRIGTRGKEFRRVSCAEVFRSVCRSLRRLIEESGARIEAEALPEVMADEVQLGQVFQNVLENAIKFRGSAPPHVLVRADREAECWRISVTDNGIGIDERHHEEVFEVFRRLHRREEIPGTGIGLSIVRKIVRRHGGFVRLENVPEGGLCLSFTLPAAPDQ